MLLNVIRMIFKPQVRKRKGKKDENMRNACFFLECCLSFRRFRFRHVIKYGGVQTEDRSAATNITKCAVSKWA